MFERMTNWDSKTVLAALFLIGYFGLILFLPGMLEDLDENGRDIVSDLVKPLGPVIGIIAFAIWRNSRRDNVEAEANANAARENADTLKLLAHKSPPATTGSSDHPHTLSRDPWDRDE